MRFIGGKARIAKHLAPIVLETKPAFVIEPFCGGLHMTVALLRHDPDLVVFASDAHTDLIDMWKAVQDGWDPPGHVSREEYYAAKNAEPSPERTFIGYGCSFSGKWFGGYANDSTGRNYALNAKRSIDKIKSVLPRIVFTDGDYQDVTIRQEAVVYCDPPYKDTTKPGERLNFDHKLFWEWVDRLPVLCYVSEYTAPPEFGVVWSKPVTTDMHTLTGQARREERLFINHV
ncbi:MAG: DNA adenine methylase [Hyphomicrobiaceae bacterium]